MRPATCSGSTSGCDHVNGSGPGSALAVDYFDGRSARAQPVRIRIDGSELHVTADAGSAFELRLPLREVTWPERTRHGARIAHLRRGGALQARDPSRWDEWLQANGVRDSPVVRLQQSWRWVIAGTAALVLGIAVFFVWGLPSLARGVVALIPPAIDARIGESALDSIDGQLLQPSSLSLARQERVRAAFDAALSALPPDSAGAPHRLLFRKSRIGPNAFALPGGAIVLTDELVELVRDDTAVLTGVLAHELGHVRQRHGMRLLVQVGALGALASLVLGDFSTLLASAPVLLGQAAYSRDAEREADAHAVRVLQAARISPEVMVSLFEKLAEKRGDAKGSDWLGVAIASHPADAARIAYFRAAALGR